MGGYPYIPMIQYKRHKNRVFFQNKVNIVWLWPLPLSMPVKDFFIYFFLVRGDLELNLYFSLFAGSGLDLDYVCMFVYSKFS